MTLALVLAALLAITAVVAVALPFLRDPEPISDTLVELGEHERRRLAQLEARDRALAALKELEFDHRTGTISDDDYRTLVGPLRREVARTLRDDASHAGSTAETEQGRPAGGRTP
ncbi:MAG TPA: hypothetical protein VMN35_06350 [Gaiellaceae bacterium]|nr:hypothetical protein [Gaiellaceae bacterium]